MSVLSARAQQLSRAGDVDGFVALAGTRDRLTALVAGSSDLSILGEIIFASTTALTAEYFYHGAKRLGLEKMSQTYLEQYSAFRDSNAARKIRMRSVDDSGVTERGSSLIDPVIVSIAGVVESPPPITVDQLAPVRYADHALVMRAGLAAITAVLILACLLVFLFRFVFPPVLRKTADRMLDLLRPGDWCIVIGFGTVLPFFGVLALQRLTVSGGREWAVDHFLYLFPGTHLTTLLLLMLFAPVFLVRRRLSRRSVALGIPCRPGLLSGLAGLAVLALPFVAYPVVLKFGPTPLVMKALAAVPACCLVAICWSVLQSFVANAASRISLAATSMALLPAYAVATILSSLMLPVYRDSEENWLAQDTLHNPDPDAADFGQYESRLAAEKRRETRVILGLEK